MVKMSDKSKRFLERNMPETVSATAPNDILEPLYNLIMDRGFVSHEAGYNDFGREAQEVYDDIFYSNFED